MNEVRTTHTPGPWKLLAVGDGTSRMCPADADGLSLLTIVDEEGGDFAAVYNDADARLIAAAPDLLAELKRMHEHFSAFAADHSMEASTETWAALHCAKAAIASAESSS